MVWLEENTFKKHSIKVNVGKLVSLVIQTFWCPVPICFPFTFDNNKKKMFSDVDKPLLANMDQEDMWCKF